MADDPNETRHAQMFPAMSNAQVARIAPSGAPRSFAMGEILGEQGDVDVPFYVVVEGVGADAARPGARRTAREWPLERAPYLFETSQPRVFAVGDVRANSVKRVASAVGRVLSESVVVE